MSTTLEPTVEVQREALTWPERAKALVIDTPESYSLAAEMLKGIKGLRAKIADTFGPLKAKAHAAWKAIRDEEKKADAPLTEAEGVIKRAMVTWEAEQERIRQAEQRRLAEEARQAEETRRLAEAAALEREAMATGDAALLAEAEDIIAEPVMAPVVILPPATPKVAGISYREQWDYEVTNDALIPREFLVRDDKKIAGVVRAMKGATKIPGIRAFSRKVVAAGGGR